MNKIKKIIVPLSIMLFYSIAFAQNSHLIAESAMQINYSISALANNSLDISLTGKSGQNLSPSNLFSIALPKANITSGQFDLFELSSNLTLTIPDGATLGHTDNNQGNVYIYALNNSGIIELAVIGETLTNTGGLFSTTAIGINADSSSILYSNTTVTNAPVRLLGRIYSTQIAAGTWAANLLQVDLAPFMIAGSVGSTQWTPLTFLNGWSNLGGGYSEAKYMKDANDFVHLQGTITGGSCGNEFFTLLSGFRPSARIILGPPSSHSSGSTRVDVLTSGNAYPIARCDNGSISLDGIKFSTN